MNTRLMRSIILPLGLISTLFLGMLPFSFAPAKAQTNNALAARFSKYSPTKAPFLAPGSRGQAVRDVQAALQRLGFYNGAVDGIYGSRTATAVATFQRSHRIVGDGRVGALTWQALRSSIAPRRRSF
ncbi:peptidoglycan-binding domain-containing protein [Nostoc punctiforme]|uniref:Peptidoglycan-binding domain 1 protein n=1 Tax=Nostoc punctiforme (strain ATCC 29133 / PCC 73102) TaxID=63737 RepID=B2IXP9_NOSP7|nr:peptidoglycan-binding domain-containing protein [Nostoc punctiforme]ACC81577.1 Peptidoglycan-binding domain 1 protein [Nostoc punctiforme PCC 73102]